MQLARFHQKLKNFDDFEKDEAVTYLWRAGLLDVKGGGMTIRYIIPRCLAMFLKGGKVSVVQY